MGFWEIRIMVFYIMIGIVCDIVIWLNIKIRYFVNGLKLKMNKKCFIIDDRR